MKRMRELNKLRPSRRSRTKCSRNMTRPRGGLRTWPYIRTPSKTEGVEPDRITHFTDLKQEPNKRYTQATYDAVRPDSSEALVSDAGPVDRLASGCAYSSEALVGDSRPGDRSAGCADSLPG